MYAHTETYTNIKILRGPPATSKYEKLGSVGNRAEGGHSMFRDVSGQVADQCTMDFHSLELAQVFKDLVIGKYLLLPESG